MTNTKTTTTKTNHYFGVLVALAALTMLAAMLLTASKPAHAATTFTVNDKSDSPDALNFDNVCDVNLAVAGNQCTLRAAIQQANKTTGADVINFNIPEGSRDPSSGVAMISVGYLNSNGALPKITDRVTIDGYSQPGSSPNTLAEGTNAALKIRLNGANAGDHANGLHILGAGASGSVVKGLVIGGFGADGIQIEEGSDQNTIEGNFIGTDPSGTLSRYNYGDGVDISSGSNNNTVGGNPPAARNLISGNGGSSDKGASGVHIRGSFDRVMGNLIGTKKDGTTAIGGYYGTSDSGNYGHGVIVSGSKNTLSSNTIAFNSKDGVLIQGLWAAGNASGNGLFGNRIFSNAKQGIDLAKASAYQCSYYGGCWTDFYGDGVTPNDSGDADSGANTLQNFPVLSSAKTVGMSVTTIQGTLNSTPNKTFNVQFFSNPAGGDEGKKYIGSKGVTTDASGNASFTFQPASAVAAGQTVTATATLSETNNFNTSEFSAPRTVASDQ